MISRRMVVGGLAALPATAAIARRDVRGGFYPTVQAAVKVQADLNPRRSAPWWYDIVLYAMRPSEPPLALVAAEGCEHNFARPGGEGGYVVRNATVSCFKDAVTGEWLDGFDNPVTGRRNMVRANMIQGGATLIAANGRDIFRDDSDMARSQISGAASHGPVRIGSFRWLESGDRLCLVKEAIGAGSYQPLMETSSTWVDRRALVDPRTTSAAATFSSSFVSPWMPWLDMAGVEGFLLWHATGRKLASLAELPAAFRARAEQLAPGLLAANPFDRRP